MLNLNKIREIIHLKIQTLVMLANNYPECFHLRVKISESPVPSSSRNLLSSILIRTRVQPGMEAATFLQAIKI